MTFAINGLAVSRGIAIGRAVLVASSRIEVQHYFIESAQASAEVMRARAARHAVIEELQRLQAAMPADAPTELYALLDVHLMLLQDESLVQGVEHWICERLYNAEWALTTQLEMLSRQFDEMEDEYLRERKADLEQVVDRILRHLTGAAAAPERKAGLLAAPEVPLILVAQDLSPADMLHFKTSVFAGFVTAGGGKTSHTAIVARSMDIPAVVGARAVGHLVRQDDWLIIDGNCGVVIVDPTHEILAEYQQRQRENALERDHLARLRHTPAVTRDGASVELLANIEQPSDGATALLAGAQGVGLFRSEFLFMGRNGPLPCEEEQYQAYRQAIDGMQGRPVTIRTIDVGADKPLDKTSSSLNPALGLRAIRWSLADPAMFRTQLRAVLRAAVHGPVNLLFPMLAHQREIEQTLAQVELARAELAARSVAYGPVQLGAMIEIPAAALMVRMFLRYFDFLSIGTNDLIQYTLAIDRADEAVAHLYDPLHPAVLRLVAEVIAEGQRQGKSICVCGEVAGDVAMTRLLLGLGLRSFSMHPAQILAVKQQVLRADASELAAWAQQVVQAHDPAAMLEADAAQQTAAGH